MKIQSYHENNNKKKFIIIFTVICMILVVAVFLYHSYAWYESEKIFNSFSGNVTPVGDIYFSVYVDGVASENIPTITDGINFEHAECTNGATATWDKTSWSPIIHNLTSSRTKCTLYFADNSASSVITKLVGNADPTSVEEINNGTDESGCTNTLAYDDFGNLRYTGANPCNYVTFNDESAGWRIIGSFDGYVKIIRSNSIGDYSFDSSASSVNVGWGINQWGESGTYTGADLMKLLNPGFEDNLAEDSSGNAIAGTTVNNSLYWNRGSGNCYNSNNNAKTTCSFDSSGLTSNAKTMIDKHIWYVGSQGNNDVLTSGNGLGLAKKHYEYERSNNTGKICSSGTYCNDTVIRTTTWEGYVGLMSPSDYGYAVGGEVRDNCLTNTNLYVYNTNSCYTNDWLFNSEHQMTISPLASSLHAVYMFYERSSGEINRTNASFNVSIRPTLFLKSSVAITGGNGTSTNPYVLSSTE